MSEDWAAFLAFMDAQIERGEVVPVDEEQMERIAKLVKGVACD